MPLVNIKTDGYIDILKSSLIPQSDLDKFHKVLLYFKRRTKEFGDRIPSPHISIGYVKDEKNLDAILQELLDRNYIKEEIRRTTSETQNSFTSIDESEFYLTLDGMEYINNIKNKQNIRKADNVQTPKHVFISCVTEDKDMAIKLKEDLEKNEIKVWIDRKSLQPGDKSL